MIVEIFFAVGGSVLGGVIVAILSMPFGRRWERRDIVAYLRKRGSFFLADEIESGKHRDADHDESVL